MSPLKKRSASKATILPSEKTVKKGAARKLSRTLPSGSALTFAEVLASFVGFLQANQKAANTIVSYQGDLRGFGEFLEKGLGSRRVGIQSLTRKDLEAYQGYLEAQGFKVNTRRRKLLVLRKLLKWLHGRNKLGAEIGIHLPTLARSERIPFTVDLRALLSQIRKLPAATEMDLRNKALLGLLAETGCTVSEVRKIRFDHVRTTSKEAWVEFEGDKERRVPVSRAWVASVNEIKKARQDKKNPVIFVGYNRFGPLGSPISSRGVEHLVRAYSVKLGEKKLVPRTIRHSTAVHWAKQGVDPVRIQVWLGLRSTHAKKTYDAIIKAKLRSSERAVPTVLKSSS